MRILNISNAVHYLKLPNCIQDHLQQHKWFYYPTLFQIIIPYNLKDILFSSLIFDDVIGGGQ